MVEPEVTIWRVRVASWISKATRTHAHAHAHAPGHLQTHTHANARVHTNTRKYVILFFHGNSGYVNALQYYVTRTLRVLLRSIRVLGQRMLPFTAFSDLFS